MGNGEQWIVVPRWDEFQHRDAARTQVPPWIKTYTKLLSDDDFLDLSHHLRGVLLGVWLEYARSTRQLSDSTVRLSRRLGCRVTRGDLKSLNDAGWITFSASKPASSHASTDASLEKRRVETPLPPAGKPARPRRHRQPTDPTHEETNPHVCGVDGCQVRHATEARILEHRENVHGITTATPNGDQPADLTWLQSIEPDPEENPE